jgi:hypothetical protein
MSEDIVLTIAPKSNTWSSTDQNMVDAWIRSTVGAQLSVSARSRIAARDAGVIQQAAMLTAHVVFLYHGTGGATESYVTQKSKIKKTKELKKGIQIAAARPDATTGQNTMPTTKQNQLVMKHFQKACKWYIHDASAPLKDAKGFKSLFVDPAPAGGTTPGPKGPGLAISPGSAVSVQDQANMFAEAQTSANRAKLSSSQHDEVRYAYYARTHTHARSSSRHDHRLGNGRNVDRWIASVCTTE